MIGRTEDERDLLRVKGGRDVGGDDRLRVDKRDGDDSEEEMIDDMNVRKTVGDSSQSQRSTRAWHRVACTEHDVLFVARRNASTLDHAVQGDITTSSAAG
jgi:hypothetical protein